MAAVKKKTDKRLIYYILSVLMLLVLIYPIVGLNNGVGTRIGIPLYDEIRSSSSSPWSLICNHIYNTFLTLFYAGQDRGDINLYGDPYFGLTEVLFIFPGLVLIFLRPTWPMFFIFLSALAGLIPHVLSDPGGNRLIGSIGPFLLIGALGINQFIEAASQTSNPGLWKKLTWVLLFGVFAFGAVSTFEKVYLYFNTMKYPPVVAAGQIQEDSAKNRVYGSYQCFGAVGIMTEKSPSHLLLMDSNPIYLEPDESRPDVVVLLEEASLPKPDIIETLKKQYPQAQWEELALNPGHPKGDNINPLYRMFIPGAQLSEDKSKLIHVEMIPQTHWLRRYYSCGYRMGRGIILFEDRVADLTEPVPPGIKNQTIPWASPAASVRCEGGFEAPADGNYSFKVETDNQVDLWFNDQRILSLRPGKKTAYMKNFRLSQGHYSVRLLAHSPNAPEVPLISIRYPGTDVWMPL